MLSTGNGGMGIVLIICENPVLNCMEVTASAPRCVLLRCAPRALRQSQNRVGKWGRRPEFVPAARACEGLRKAGCRRSMATAQEAAVRPAAAIRICAVIWRKVADGGKECANKLNAVCDVPLEFPRCGVAHDRSVGAG